MRIGRIGQCTGHRMRGEKERKNGREAEREQRQIRKEERREKIEGKERRKRKEEYKYDFIFSAFPYFTIWWS